MKIAVCDDEKRYAEEVKNYIWEYVFQTDAAIETDCFENGSALLERERYDLYLLDYSMPQINGVELAVKLKEKFGDRVSFCYFTTYETAAVQVINNSIKAEAFLVKPVKKEELLRVVERLYRRSAVNRLVLKKDKSFVTVYVEDILYAEARNKETVLHCTQANETFGYMFSSLVQNELPSDLFFKVHRSYAVNLSHVKGFTKNSVLLDNGESIPLSKTAEFRQALDRFHFNSF